MKKLCSRLGILSLALALVAGLLFPAQAAANAEPLFWSCEQDDILFVTNERVPGFGDNRTMRHMRPGATIKLWQNPNFEGVIMAVWFSTIGSEDKGFCFSREQGNYAPMETASVSFAKGQILGGKTMDLSDPTKTYVLSVNVETEDGATHTSNQFFRVGDGGENVPVQPAAVNPLIVKDGLDYDSVGSHGDGYFKVEKDGKVGLIDSMGNEIVPPLYTFIGDISDGMVRVGASVDGTRFGERKYGYVNVATGELAIPTEYDDQEISDFSNGYAVITRKEEIRYRAPGDTLDTLDAKIMCGLVDKQGNMVIPLGDFYICPSWEFDSLSYDFSANRIVTENGGKYIVMDTQGNILFEPQFDSVAGYRNGFAIVEQNGKQGFIDTQGNVVVPPQYDFVGDFDNDGYARVSNNGLSGAVNRQGELIVPIKYDGIGDFSEGMVCVAVDDPDVPYAYRFGFVDTTTGNLVIPPVYCGFGFIGMGMSKFKNGLAHVALADERFSEINSWQTKHGYIDKQGNVVIPIEYSDADDFSDGLARVQKGTENCFGIDQYLDDKEGYDRLYAKFKELGIDPEYLYIDTAGNVVRSFDPGTGTNRFYTERSADGTWAILRNPLYRESATPNRSTVLVNGQSVAFDAYTINQNNYFKLRDLAKVLSGTGKQFEVTWDGSNNAINMLSDKPYTAVGGELAQGDGADKTATVNTATVYLDGQPVSLLAYTINQNNYFKLRDVGQAFDFDVTWDGTQNTIVIDTAKSYTPD